MLENNNLIRISNGIRNGNSFSQSRWNWMENSSIKKKLPGVDRDLLFGQIGLAVCRNWKLFVLRKPYSLPPFHLGGPWQIWKRLWKKKKIIRGILYVDCSVWQISRSFWCCCCCWGITPSACRCRPGPSGPKARPSSSVSSHGFSQVMSFFGMHVSSCDNILLPLSLLLLSSPCPVPPSVC